MVEFQSGGSIEMDLKKFKSNLKKKAGGKLNGPKDLKTARASPPRSSAARAACQGGVRLPAAHLTRIGTF